MKKFESFDEKIKEYFKILSPSFPNWLDEYISCREMERLDGVSVTCGTYYSSLLKNKSHFSSLAHSIGVALIIWHFTKDKKMTLAGLFHDISTPVFKHAIDFLNGDYEKQESTEELTSKIIENSKEIMQLLKRDGISISEVDNYKIYPIADNETPLLSADRLEYTLSNALLVYGIEKMENIKRYFNNLEIQKNENGEIEIGFKDKDVARDFAFLACKLSKIYRGEVSRYSMQFLADIVKKLNEEKVIKKDDLFKLSEKEVIEIIKNSKYGEYFKIWSQASHLERSKDKIDGIYQVKIRAKTRYIDPLCKGERMSKIDEATKKEIEKNFLFDMNDYLYLSDIRDF